MFTLSHQDPALHTAAAYKASAARIKNLHPEAAELFQQLYEVQLMIENPAVSFSSVIQPIRFAIKNYADTGVLVGVHGKSERVLDEELRRMVEWAGRTSHMAFATGYLGSPENFAVYARSLTPGSVEYDQVQVFGERLDRYLREESVPEIRTQSVHATYIDAARAHGEFLLNRMRNEQQPEGISKATDDGLFQANYAGEANAIYALRRAPADIIVRKVEDGFALQIDKDGHRQVIEVETAENAAALFRASIKIFRIGDRDRLVLDDIKTHTDALTGALKTHGYVAKDFRLEAYLKDAGRENPADPNETIFQKLSSDIGARGAVELPALVNRPIEPEYSTDRLRLGMQGMIVQAAEASGHPTFQIQASKSEMAAVVLRPTDDHPSATARTLHSEATIMTMIRFMNAVRQPEFMAMPDGSRAATGRTYEGVNGFLALRDTFGPVTPEAFVGSHIPNLAQLDPTHSTENERPGADPELARRYAEEMATRRILEVRAWGITNTTPTRALHLDAEHAKKVIDAMPEQLVRQAYADLRDVCRNNATRLADRRQMTEAVQFTQRIIAQRAQRAATRSHDIER